MLENAAAVRITCGMAECGRIEVIGQRIGVVQVAGFAELGVSENRVSRLKTMGITAPTPVQAETIPVVMRGSDVISQAQTGTGKTLAFVLPMLEKIDTEQPRVQGLIVTPTRELALQITAEIKKLLQPEDGVRVLAVYGGQDVEAQLLKLKGNIHMVIATPGRLLDHLRRETVDLSGVKMLVLDEADQMLHMGFLGEVEEVLRATPYKRQTMLFSATMPPSIREMAGRILRNPEHVTVKAERVTVKDIRQWVVETTDRAKQATLVRLLGTERPYLAMIFCRTKRRASTLNEALQEMGFASDELHGDLSQAKREKVMKEFRQAKLQLLVATDVAARGLDVEGVTHVFNYDIPQDVESYIHRIGRTGRAGEKGLAITLAAPKDQRELADIESGIEQAIERRTAEGEPMGGRFALQPRGGGGKPARGGDGERRGGGGNGHGGGGSGKFTRDGGRAGTAGGERRMAGKGKRGAEEELRRAAAEREAARAGGGKGRAGGGFGRKQDGPRAGAGGADGRKPGRNSGERGFGGRGGSGDGFDESRLSGSKGSGHSRGSVGGRPVDERGFGRSNADGKRTDGRSFGRSDAGGKTTDERSFGRSVTGKRSEPRGFERSAVDRGGAGRNPDSRGRSGGGSGDGRAPGPKSSGRGGFRGSPGGPSGGNRGGGGGGRRSAPRGR